MDVETALAGALRSYLSADDEAKQGAGRKLSNTVAWVTGELLKAEESWSRYWWVDDLLEESIEIVSPLAVEIRGDLIWGDERNQWTEPFRGRISLTALSGDAPSYDLQLGDAARGLQEVPYGTREHRPRSVTEWVFTFRAQP